LSGVAIPRGRHLRRPDEGWHPVPAQGLGWRLLLAAQVVPDRDGAGRSKPLERTPLPTPLDRNTPFDLGGIARSCRVLRSGWIGVILVYGKEFRLTAQKLASRSDG